MMTLTDGQKAVSDYGPDGEKLTAQACRREAYKLRYGGVVELKAHFLIVAEASCFTCDNISGCVPLIPLEAIETYDGH